MGETGWERYLSPTAMIDSDHPLVIDLARDSIGGEKDPVGQAVRLYYRVRDGFRYDPYLPFFLPEHYRASNVIKSGRGFCISKAGLLCALGRAVGIPSRVGFATVRNHLMTRQFLEFQGTDRMVYHGFTEFYLEGKWVKATPAFNIELCHKHKVPPLEFNGREDSIFHPYNLERKQFMEYLEFHGSYDDIPVATIVAAMEEEVGEERVRKWMRDLQGAAGKPLRDFHEEEVWKG